MTRKQKALERRRAEGGRRSSDARGGLLAPPSHHSADAKPSTSPTQTKRGLHSPSVEEETSFLSKFEAWLTDSPSARSIHYANILTITASLMVSGFLFAKLGVFTPTGAGSKPGELDISGEWKIRFEDLDEFKVTGLNDSSWCSIRVPDSGMSSARRSSESKDCPAEAYPRSLMRNSTYWYRTKFHIPHDRKWTDPAIFLGAIKERGWIYWDGEFVETVSLDRSPSVVLLNPRQVASGEHVLAVRVSSVNNQNPGIFHAYPRRVVIGEFKNLLTEERYLERSTYENVIVIVVQFSALVILMMLLLGERGSNERHSWLGIYFVSSLAYSSSALFSGDLRTYVECSGVIFLSISLMGYGVDFLTLKSKLSRLTKRSVTIYAGMMLAIGVNCIYSGPGGLRVLNLLEIGTALVPMLILSLIPAIRTMHQNRDYQSASTISRSERLIAATLLLTHICICTELFLTRYFPVYFHVALIVALLTVLVTCFAVWDYIEKQTAMAFYGRFIRPGLRTLLKEHRQSFYSDQKLFRGRKIPIMKIDVVAHTASTFGMPYGVKRLFQDLFFTHVDYVVADKIFLDRSEGDGSIYFFDERISKTPCSDALASAFVIQEQAVRNFDREFSSRLDLLVSSEPELAGPMSNFRSRFEEKTGTRFEQRQTRVRVSFVYGFVDEGLWGLTSQSHYGLEGDLMTVLARLEKTAADNEILVTKDFAEKVRTESRGSNCDFEFTERLSDLKGIGEFVVVSVKKTRQGSLAA
jgi:hypothetical protein